MPPRIIIGALTGAAMEDRKNRCRQTWMADAAALGVRAMFLGAASDGPRLNGDILECPAHDAYAFLPQKTLWFCRWAIERDDWDWLFKCDDDTYVCVERLLAATASYPPGTEYVGAEWTPGVNYGSGGAGYLINRRAAEIVAKHLINPTGSEDAMVGEVLRANGIGLRIDTRFVPYGSEEKRPKPDNQYITLHAIGAEIFLKTHSELHSETVKDDAATPVW